MPSEFGDVVRAGFDKACDQFTERVKALGFCRGKKRYWVRVRPFTADVIHLFREGSSYGAPCNAEVGIRVSFFIRVLNVSSERLTNGPYTGDFLGVGRYHLRFNAKSGSNFERCVDDLIRFVQEHGEPWFAKYSDAGLLVEGGASPLSEDEREGLRQHLQRGEVGKRILASHKLLGIKPTSR